MNRKKRTGLAMTIPGGLLYSAGVMLLLTILFSAILAKLLEKGTIRWDESGCAAALLLFAISFAGAMAGMQKVKRRFLMTAAACILIYFIMLLSITALFFGGQYEAVGETILVLLLGGMTALLLEAGLKKFRSVKRNHR